MQRPGYIRKGAPHALAQGKARSFLAADTSNRGPVAVALIGLSRWRIVIATFLLLTACSPFRQQATEAPLPSEHITVKVSTAEAIPAVLAAIRESDLGVATAL